CADSVFHDFSGNAILYGRDGPDTAPQSSFFLDGNEHAGPACRHLLRQIFREQRSLTAAHICLHCLTGQAHISILFLPACSDLCFCLFFILLQEVPFWISSFCLIRTDAVSHAEGSFVGQSLRFHCLKIQCPG